MATIVWVIKSFLIYTLKCVENSWTKCINLVNLKKRPLTQGQCHNGSAIGWFAKKYLLPMNMQRANYKVTKQEP